MRRLLVCELPPLPYAEVLELQRAVARARIAGALADDVLLLVEHPPVITLGRASKDANLVASPALLAARGVERYEVDRGGDVTFHGPGQLVGYPVLDLKQHRQDLHWYLRMIEQALIEALRPFGIEGSRSPGFTGVWVDDRKLASIGVHARDWVTWHGFALNVTTDLDFFDLIVPCGIAGVRMTSIARERATLGAPGGDATVLMQEVRATVARAFARVFELATEPMAAVELRRALTNAGVMTDIGAIALPGAGALTNADAEARAIAVTGAGANTAGTA